MTKSKIALKLTAAFLVVGFCSLSANAEDELAPAPAPVPVPVAEVPKPKPVVPKSLPELEKVKCRQYFEAEVEALQMSSKTNSPCTEKYHDASTFSLFAKASKTRVDYKRTRENENHIFAFHTSVLGNRQTKIISYDDQCKIKSVSYIDDDRDDELEVTKRECLFIVTNYKLVKMQKIKDEEAAKTTYLIQSARDFKLPKLLSHYKIYKNVCKQYFEKELEQKYDQPPSAAQTPAKRKN